MERRSADIETVPHSLEASLTGKETSSYTRSFAEIVSDFFRKNGQSGGQLSRIPPGSLPDEALSKVGAPASQPVPNSILYKHWNAIKVDGISATQFIAFLQPLADLDGITVSYTYSDEDGKEHVYNRRREETSVTPDANPLSEAIRKGKLSKEKALTFALNEEGRVWIESNFLDLK